MHEKATGGQIWGRGGDIVLDRKRFRVHNIVALTPFPGIALRGETCGAVIGRLVALGLIYGRDDLDDWKGYLASVPPSRRFCRRFQKEHSSTACVDILEIQFGRRYHLANRVDALKYAVAGGQKKRGKVIESAVQIAAEIILKKE